MANILFWNQGSGSTAGLKCSGVPDYSAPESKRVAAEYMRGFYTLTNVINSQIDTENYGNLGWQGDYLAEGKAGDVVWMLLVPPNHKVLDFTLQVKESMDEFSSIADMTGFTLTPVAALITKPDESGVAQPIDYSDALSDLTFGTPVVGTTMTGANLTTAYPNTQEIVLAPKDANTFLPPNTYYAVGVRIDALPAGKTLADLPATIGLIAHAMDYDTQTQM